MGDLVDDEIIFPEDPPGVPVRSQADIERIVQLEAEVARLRGAVKAAYREGFTDADHSGLSEEDFDDEWRECWEISTAKEALQETDDDRHTLTYALQGTNINTR